MDNNLNTKIPWEMVDRINRYNRDCINNYENTSGRYIDLADDIKRVIFDNTDSPRYDVIGDVAIINVNCTPIDYINNLEKDAHFNEYHKGEVMEKKETFTKEELDVMDKELFGETEQFPDIEEHDNDDLQIGKPIFQRNRVELVGNISAMKQEEDKNGNPYASVTLQMYSFKDKEGNIHYDHVNFMAFGQEKVDELNKIGQNGLVHVKGTINQKTDMVKDDFGNNFYTNEPQQINIRSIVKAENGEKPINIVRIAGRIKSKSELKDTKNGSSTIMATVTNAFKDKETGEMVYMDNSVRAFGESAQMIDKMEKGQELLINGKFTHNEVDGKEKGTLIALKVDPGMTKDERDRYWDNYNKEQNKDKSLDKQKDSHDKDEH